MTTQVRNKVAQRSARTATLSPKLRHPFAWLRPAAPGTALPAKFDVDLGYLQFFAEPDVSRMQRALVAFSMGQQHPRSRPFPQPPSISVLNRRRRAALLWINAVLRGDTSPQTLHSLTYSWLPHLAGTGPSVRRAARRGRFFIEHLRGLISASVFAEFDPSLMRQARAQHALEVVLAAHLQAILAVAARPVPSA